MAPSAIGEFEQLVLLAVVRLESQGYAVTIRHEIEEQTGRRVSRGAVYMTLERLQDKGLLRSHLADPTPERGGRSKRIYAITPIALIALRDARRALLRMWADIETALERV
jgi:PadR family transcriptional regulator, regulatory protein PadR